MIPTWLAATLLWSGTLATGLLLGWCAAVNYQAWRPTSEWLLPWNN